MSFLFRTVMLLGAAGAFALTLHVGRNNHSLLLLMLFGLWVPAPFIGISALHTTARNWSSDARSTLEIAGFLLTLVSLGLYAHVAYGPPQARPASLFLVVPALSWIAIAATALLCRNLSAES
jgi:hypothetical protein